MNKLANALHEAGRETTTVNGQFAYNSTKSYVLDFFAKAGAIRAWDDDLVLNAFHKAFNENALLATKTLFYTRDVRGGLGERDVFRTILHDMAVSNPDIVLKNLALIPEYGRYDDLYSLVDTPVEQAMWEFMQLTFKKDVENMQAGKPITLLAKWIELPDRGTKVQRKLGSKTMNKLGYRNNRIEGIKLVVKMREYLSIPERAIAAKAYDKIDYSTIPSMCMNKYRKAFIRNDGDRYNEFIASVARGEAKIKTGAITPVDLVKATGFTLGVWICAPSIKASAEEMAAIEAQWKELPDYVVDANAIVMADVSGSMERNGADPLYTSLALAVYFAEHNSGPFADMVMTFSSSPSLVNIQRKLSLKDKLIEVGRIEWRNSTNIEAALNTVLEKAIESHCSQDDMPKSIIIISDMQFYNAVYDRNGETISDAMKRRYAEHGYTLPRIVYWNVNALADNFQFNADDVNICAVSGKSASTFQSVLNMIATTPYDSMLEILNSARYEAVTV